MCGLPCSHEDLGGGWQICFEGAVRPHQRNGSARRRNLESLRRALCALASGADPLLQSSSGAAGRGAVQRFDELPASVSRTEACEIGLRWAAHQNLIAPQDGRALGSHHTSLVVHTALLRQAVVSGPGA
jgi:hypothetical protein